MKHDIFTHFPYLGNTGVLNKPLLHCSETMCVLLLWRHYSLKPPDLIRMFTQWTDTVLGTFTHLGTTIIEQLHCRSLPSIKTKKITVVLKLTLLFFCTVKYFLTNNLCKIPDNNQNMVIIFVVAEGSKQGGKCHVIGYRCFIQFISQECDLQAPPRLQLDPQLTQAFDLRAYPLPVCNPHLT